VTGENIGPGTIVMKNFGPGTLIVDTGWNDRVELVPDRVRVITTRNTIQVASIDENSALFVFEFIPHIRLK
jgi:hypothetical protein